MVRDSASRISDKIILTMAAESLFRPNPVPNGPCAPNGTKAPFP